MPRIYLWLNDDGEAKAAFDCPPKDEDGNDYVSFILDYEGERPTILDAYGDVVAVEQ